jgi:hypothetical protein
MKNHSEAMHIYDTEIHCSRCGARLYIPTLGAALVADSLKRKGLAGLQCLCGQVQFIGPDLQPISNRGKSQTEKTE